MNNRPLYITLQDDEKLESGVIKRPLSSYWIEKLLTESDGVKIGRLAAIGLAKNHHRIKELLDSGDLVFVPYKTARTYSNIFPLYRKKEIESISIEDNKFVIKLRKS